MAMEKIEQAIRKARAVRAQQQGAPSGAAGAISPKPAPVVADLPKEPAAAKPDLTGRVTTASADRAANWLALERLKANQALLERHRIVSFLGGPPAIQFDVLRTKVLRTMRVNNWRRLAITSPSSACGKTMTCLNLAFSLGRQADIHTIVIEADLRRPSMAATLGVRPRHLFASVMEGKSSASAHMVRHGDNLAFGTNYLPARNSAELLHSNRLGEVLREIEDQFAPDLMIFDMPPMQVSDDTIAFLGQVDCVLLVAAAGKSTIAEVDLCEQELAAQTSVMGVILNKCRYLDKSQGYGYDYYG